MTIHAIYDTLGQDLDINSYQEEIDMQPPFSSDFRDAIRLTLLFGVAGIGAYITIYDLVGIPIMIAGAAGEIAFSYYCDKVKDFLSLHKI